MSSTMAVDTTGEVVGIDLFPDTCPVCGMGVEATFYVARIRKSDRAFLQAVFQCPRNDCNSFFIGCYYRDKDTGYYWLEQVEPRKKGEERRFPSEIDDLSSRFVKIYNQALQAEQYGLDEISGPGYGKALEFLIKDYLCQAEPTKATELQSAFLGTCIANYVNDPRIKECAQKAAWLRNDEVHYIRKWADKDLQDLKILIDLTVNWIHSILLTEKYSSTMQTP